MKIIVPMAGMGKRMRPHTLTTPKPLIAVGGKPIVQRLVEQLASISNEQIEEVAFIIGDFGKEVEDNLISIAEQLGAKGSIHYQEEALGTAHAILCAKEALEGRVVIAFADTLFRSEFQLEDESDGIIWVQQVDDPRAFGVVSLDDGGRITGFVEKPESFVSDLAIIGIYYFKSGENLRDELQYLIDNNITDKGEYQLTDALKNMQQKGLLLKPGKVIEWLDCGNKNATVYANQRVLEHNGSAGKPSKIENSTIVEPCFIGEGVTIINSTVGPHVSIGANTVVSDSQVVNSIIQTNTEISSCQLSNSMVGNFVNLNGAKAEMSMGDFTSFTGAN